MEVMKADWSRCNTVNWSLFTPRQLAGLAVVLVEEVEVSVLQGPNMKFHSD